ncbi:MAG TPA: MaoC family dehydratase [Anaerolineae bacterium]|nr:MaoC family dehydratase [Anaerolineae bacterium]HID85191.1 MaoC family dehydratase [Anaerolineales bacterium]HIQ08995.1 MaoC family dehydratase [Anaerolineaceae bacterium]
MAGKYYEDLQVGMRIQHALGRTITEADNTLFCALTMNPQPLHLNEDFAAQTRFGRRIVNGLLTMALVVGLTVPDLTQGTIVANLGYEKVVHPHPVFHGDTIYVETEVLAMRESRSRPHVGIVRLRHIGRNQDGVVVCELERTVMFLKRSAVEPGKQEG